MSILFPRDVARALGKREISRSCLNRESLLSTTRSLATHRREEQGAGLGKLVWPESGVENVRRATGEKNSTCIHRVKIVNTTEGEKK